MMAKIAGITIAAALFILFVLNTNFQGMRFQDITMVLRIYGVVAGIIGGIITVKVGANMISNMFIGSAILAFSISFLNIVSC